MIATLLWELGPNWIIVVLKELGLATAGELTELRIGQLQTRRNNQHNKRQTLEYQLYRTKMKRKDKGLKWVDAPTLRYVGGSLCVGTSRLPVDLDEDPAADADVEEEEEEEEEEDVDAEEEDILRDDDADDEEGGSDKEQE